jgi:hypothetical protein
MPTNRTWRCCTAEIELRHCRIELRCRQIELLLHQIHLSYSLLRIQIRIHATEEALVGRAGAWRHRQRLRRGEAEVPATEVASSTCVGLSCRRGGGVARSCRGEVKEARAACRG